MMAAQKINRESQGSNENFGEKNMKERNDHRNLYFIACLILCCIGF